MTTRQRRQVVTHLLAAFPTSARHACRLMRLSRSRWQYCPRRRDDAALRQRLRELAAAKPRWGYQQLHVLLRREGVVVNHKKVLRLYRIVAELPKPWELLWRSIHALFESSVWQFLSLWR